ncbi:MAG: biotin--[acetyl-CoA-carboxylase] ligase [Candidatus Magnetominusculus sp. LBB02]|nr:biotin--[acetyl-CoA-carboxylase] ligase [Candidatus Magnetominusculus sp. LBB02]
MAGEKAPVTGLMKTAMPPCDIFSDAVPEDLCTLRGSSFDTPYNFAYYAEIDSTNDTAKAGDFPSQTVLIADAQLKGRGRYTRDWYSPSGVNISMSIVIKPETPPEMLSLMNTAASLAVSRALRAATGLDVWPKWPNDVYIGTKKAGGILSESIIAGGAIVKLVIGIGINVNTGQFPIELKDKATSLLIESGVKYGRGRIIAAILQEFDKCRSYPAKRLISEWTAMSRTIGSYVSISGHRGIAKGLNEDGSLVITSENGKTVAINTGEAANAACR